MGGGGGGGGHGVAGVGVEGAGAGVELGLLVSVAGVACSSVHTLVHTRQVSTWTGSEVLRTVAAGDWSPHRSLLETVAGVSRSESWFLETGGHVADLHVSLAHLQTIDPAETVSQRGSQTRDLVILIVNLLLQRTNSAREYFKLDVASSCLITI